MSSVEVTDDMVARGLSALVKYLRADQQDFNPNCISNRTIKEVLTAAYKAMRALEPRVDKEGFIGGPRIYWHRRSNHLFAQNHRRSTDLE